MLLPRRIDWDRFVGLVIALLLVLSLWCWGQVSWIYLKAVLAQELIAGAWERTLANPANVQRPWQWADTWPVLRLRWQDDEDLFVLAGTAGSALAFGPGHMHGTAALGEGATVLAAHRDTHFAFLENLTMGSELRAQNAQGQWFTYRVSDARVVDSELTPLLIDPAQDALVLITCYPFEALNPGGPLRYVVTALPSDSSGSDLPPGMALNYSF